MIKGQKSLPADVIDGSRWNKKDYSINPKDDWDEFIFFKIIEKEDGKKYIELKNIFKRMYSCEHLWEDWAIFYLDSKTQNMTVEEFCKWDINYAFNKLKLDGLHGMSETEIIEYEQDIPMNKRRMSYVYEEPQRAFDNANYLIKNIRKGRVRLNICHIRESIPVGDYYGERW